MAVKKKADDQEVPGIMRGFLRGPGNRVVCWAEYADGHQVAVLADIDDDDGEGTLYDYATEGRARSRFLKEATA
jgi:hypothetical protein